MSRLPSPPARTIPKIFFVDRSGTVVGELQAEEDLPRYLRQIASS